MKKKTVYPNDELFHLWANQQIEYARNSQGNITIEKECLFSYSACIASIYNNIVLLSYDTWSNTTSNHQHKALVASNHKEHIYCYRPGEAVTEYHSSNLDSYVFRMESVIENLHRKRLPERYISSLKYFYEQLEKYCDLFNLSIPEKATELLSIDGKDKYKEYLEKVEELRLKEEEKKEKEIKEWIEVNIPLWKTGKYYSVIYRKDRDYLRLHNDRIQTSQGVYIPIELGKRLYNKIINKELKVDDEVLNFRVLEVTNEYFKVGCHTLYYDECEEIAKQLNL